MRIAIDARLNAYRRGGIPQYTRQLLSALAEVAPDDQFISLQHRDMLRPLVVAPNVLRRTAWTPPHHRFEHLSLPLELLLARPDVLHAPDFIAPRRRNVPAVVTIHDLAFKHYPQILEDSARAYYNQVQASSERAQGIIAVSEATRQDIVQFLDVPLEDVTVIYEAAEPMFRRLDLRPGEARVLNGRPVAEGTFMLFVSTLEPRKNLPTLLQALRICIDRNPHVPYRLVIAGGRGWNDEPIFQAVRDLKLADYVLFAGSVGQYDLRWLYNACRIYINPSLYEGFGLPLLEAMACGAPCLAAATSSLPEIGGDAAIYVPPLDAQMWADAIIALWDDRERQEELGRLGRARAQRFSWTRAARETLKIYRRALERADRRRPAPMPSAPPQTPSAPLPAPTPAEPPVAATEPALNAPRACLRCATPMLPGEFQYGMSIRLPDEAIGMDSLVPRAWACPRCGYAELVLEPAGIPYPRLEPAAPEAQTTVAPNAAAPAIAPNMPLEADAVVAEPETASATVEIVSDEQPDAQPVADLPADEALPEQPVADAPDEEALPQPDNALAPVDVALDGNSDIAELPEPPHVERNGDSSAHTLADTDGEAQPTDELVAVAVEQDEAEALAGADGEIESHDLPPIARVPLMPPTSNGSAAHAPAAPAPEATPRRRSSRGRKKRA